MKNNILTRALLAVFIILFTACEKDEIGGTATEKMAGEWFVVADAVDSEGNVVYEDADLFGIGYFHLDTYNISSNSLTEMWINDNGNFWDFKTRININFDQMTFAAENADNQAYESKVTIEDGKIILGAATTPSGMPADSIVFTVTFDDDPYPEAYGYYGYRVSGYRYSGFEADE